MVYNRLFRSDGLARWSVVLLISLFWLALSPQIAWAQDPYSRLTQLLAQAEEDYDMLMIDEAQAALEEAIALAEREGTQNETVAKIYMMLGIVLHASENDGPAEDAFVQAIETYPDVEINPFYRTPAVESLFARAEQRAQPSAAEPEQEEELEVMTHEPIRRARAGEALLVETRIPENLPVFRVYLYYRTFGDNDFVTSEMLPTDAINFAVTLNADQIHSTQLEYYIQGVNRSGQPIAEAGRRTNPFRISLLGSTDGDANIADRGGDGLDDPILPDTPLAPGEDDNITGFYAFLAAGTDVGFLPGGTGTPPTANPHRTVTPGLAPAHLHTYLDLGWRVSALNNIGLYFRWQFLPAQNFAALPDGHFDEQFGADPSFWAHRDECFGLGLPGDCLLGLKYERIISSGTPQFYTSIGMGVGRVRNWIRIAERASSSACDNHQILQGADGNYCYLGDTVRTGWAHFRVGGGIYYPLHTNFDLVGDANLMVLVPNTSVNLDLNFGVRLRL